MKTIVSANKISFRYEETADQPILDDISLSIEEGSFVAVLGHNGSGKSTLAKHFNAILLPQDGSVTVDGLDTRDDDLLFDIRQRVGMVFQNPDNQIVATIVEEDVAFAMENLGVDPVIMRQRVNDVLDEVGMLAFKHHAPHQLSGGQKQRVAIAGVLAMQPKCIVLDEPTAMLDPKGRREVLKTIKRLNKTMKTTVILITHFMDEAVQADRVLVMDHGKLLMDGTPKVVFAQVDQLKAVGLDVPQVTEFTHALIDQGYDLPRDILDVESCVKAVGEMLTR